MDERDKIMKKLFLFFILLFTGLGFMNAEEDDMAKREQMYREVQDFKMRYLAKEMDLTEAQRGKFFELYEEMTQNKRECYKAAREMDRKLRKDKNATDADYQRVTMAYNQASAEWNQIEVKYNEKFAEFLTPKQIYKMREAENEFRSKLEEMRHGRKKDHKR